MFETVMCSGLVGENVRFSLRMGKVYVQIDDKGRFRGNLCGLILSESRFVTL